MIGGSVGGGGTSVAGISGHPLTPKYLGQKILGNAKTPML